MLSAKEVREAASYEVCAQLSSRSQNDGFERSTIRKVQAKQHISVKATRARRFFTSREGVIALSKLLGDGRRAVFDPTPASRMRYAVRDEPCMTRLATMAAMPASTALACGDASMSAIGFDPCA